MTLGCQILYMLDLCIDDPLMQKMVYDGFVLGGRSVGGWLTAFAYGTSYFSAVVFVCYA